MRRAQGRDREMAMGPVIGYVQSAMQSMNVDELGHVVQMASMLAYSIEDAGRNHQLPRDETPKPADRERPRAGDRKRERPRDETPKPADRERPRADDRKREARRSCHHHHRDPKRRSDSRMIRDLRESLDRTTRELQRDLELYMKRR